MTSTPHEKTPTGSTQPVGVLRKGNQSDAPPSQLVALVLERPEHRFVLIVTGHHTVVKSLGGGERFEVGREVANVEWDRAWSDGAE